MQVWGHHHATLSGAHHHGILVVAGRMGCHYGWSVWESEEFCLGADRVEDTKGHCSPARQREQQQQTGECELVEIRAPPYFLLFDGCLRGDIRGIR